MSHENSIGLFVEDDATPGTEGHITLAMAGERIFGKGPWAAIMKLAVEDKGDAFYRTFRVRVCESFEGGEIRLILP